MNLVDLEDEYGYFVCLGFFVCFVLFIGFFETGILCSFGDCPGTRSVGRAGLEPLPSCLFLSLFWLSILHIHLVIHSIRNFSFFR